MTDLDLRLCNCANCRKELLGSSMKELWDSLTPVQRSYLPPMLAGRVQGRPYCTSCIQEAHRKYDDRYERPVLHMTEARGSVATGCHISVG